MLRIPVTYKDHAFTAVADGAGLDVECDSFLNNYTMGLAGELWQAIYETRLSLHPNAEDYDTTPAELIEALKEMELIK
jgi:hypothetical protein